MPKENLDNRWFAKESCHHQCSHSSFSYCIRISAGPKYSFDHLRITPFHGSIENGIARKSQLLIYVDLCFEQFVDAPQITVGGGKAQFAR